MHKVKILIRIIAWIDVIRDSKIFLMYGNEALRRFLAFLRDDKVSSSRYLWKFEFRKFVKKVTEIASKTIKNKTKYYNND